MSFLTKALGKILSSEGAARAKTVGSVSGQADLRQSYSDLVKQICFLQLKGERRMPRFPSRFGNHRQGLLLEAFAQGRHPDSVTTGFPPINENELREAVNRLSRVASRPIVLDEFTKYVTSLDQPNQSTDPDKRDDL